MVNPVGPPKLLSGLAHRYHQPRTPCHSSPLDLRYIALRLTIPLESDTAIQVRLLLLQRRLGSNCLAGLESEAQRASSGLVLPPCQTNQAHVP